jgi:hypothetical protein
MTQYFMTFQRPLNVNVIIITFFIKAQGRHLWQHRSKVTNIEDAKFPSFGRVFFIGVVSGLVCKD